MDKTPNEALRILVSAESAADAGGALQLATLIAARIPAVLRGVLMLQDEKRVAQFPCRRIVTVSGRLLVSPDAAQGERLAQSEATLFQGMLARSAKSVDASWSAEVRHGPLEAQISGEADAWDITIVGHRPMHRRRGRVLVLSSAQSKEKPLVLLARHLAERLETVVEDLTPSALSLEDLATVLDRINSANALAVVMDAETARVSRITEFLMMARCPVVILNSNSARMRLQHFGLTGPETT